MTASEFPLNGWVKVEEPQNYIFEHEVYYGYSHHSRTTHALTALCGRLDGRSLALVADFGIAYFLPFQSFLPPSPSQQIYKNPKPVLVVLVRTAKGVLLIRRAIPGYGFDLPALPGGFQVEGEDWREAACREVLEESGVVLEPEKLRVRDMKTVEDGKINLHLIEYDGCPSVGEMKHDEEVSEILFTTEAIELAFPVHTEFLRDRLQALP